jgi:hypothetical protein
MSTVLQTEHRITLQAIPQLQGIIKKRTPGDEKSFGSSSFIYVSKMFDTLVA